MADIENLVLEHLRAIRADLIGVKDRLGAVESRLSSLEITTAAIRRDLAHMYGDVVEQHTRFDQLASRVERIERRLDLMDASSA